MAAILAISSQVARGSVGLSAIVPALHALGHNVIALPTILLSNHPGHAQCAGQRTDPAMLARMLAALVANGWLGEVDIVLSGYLPSPGHVAFAASAVDQIRRLNPSCRYVCDPVLGDEPKGLYIEADAAAAIRDQLLPRADVLLPNQFELEWLSGRVAGSPEHGAVAARSLNVAEVIATSIRADNNMLATIHVSRDAGKQCLVRRRPTVPNGTGDFLSGLIAGGLPLGKAIAAVDAAIAASPGHDELQIVSSRAEWLAAPAFDEIPLDVAN